MIRVATILGAVFAMLFAIETAEAMSAYRWKKRPVVVFSGPGGEASLAEQRRIFAANRGSLAERDVVVVWVSGSTVSADLGPGPGMTAAQLRARFGAPADGFRVILVAKDGGAKLTQSSPFSTATLFAAIDAMPMRRDEMRRGR